MTSTSMLAVLAVVALSPFGDAFGAMVTAVPPAEYRPADVTPKAAATLVAPAAKSLRIVLPEPAAAEKRLLTQKNARTAATSARPVAKARPLAIGYARELPAGSRMLAAFAAGLAGRGRRSARSAHRSAIPRCRRRPARARDGRLRPRPCDSLCRQRRRRESARPLSRQRHRRRDGALRTVRDARARGRHRDRRVARRRGHADRRRRAGARACLAPRRRRRGACERLGARTPPTSATSGACNIDVACVQPLTSALQQASNSVGKLVFSDRQGFSYLCTGTLRQRLGHVVHAVPAHRRPLHRGRLPGVDDRRVLVLQGADAAAAGRSPPFVQQTSGAMLLARSADWDWALLRLNGAPPVGTFFAAWRAEPVPQLATGDRRPSSAGRPHEVDAGDARPATRSSATARASSACSGARARPRGGRRAAGVFTFFAGRRLLRGPRWPVRRRCLVQQPQRPRLLLAAGQHAARRAPVPDARRRQPAGQVVAIEFYNRTLDHYFMSTDPTRSTSSTPARRWAGCARALRFLAYSAPGAGHEPGVPVLSRARRTATRISTRPSPAECAATVAAHPRRLDLREPVGVLHRAARTRRPARVRRARGRVWRFFNRRTTNHRYTTEVTMRDEMRSDARRGSPEGYGPDAVIMCSPATNDAERADRACGVATTERRMRSV